MGNKVKRRRNNRHAENAIAKLQQSIVGVSSGLAGVSRYLEALFELSGHTVDEARAILERKDKEAQEKRDAAEQGTGSDAQGSGDVGSTPAQTDTQDPKGQPEGAA